MWVDGACLGNPGPGGWGAILRYNGRELELAGGEDDTTNNRMELSAVCEGLSALKRPCNVKVYADSRYVLDGITKGWAVRWQGNGWRTKKKEPVKNRDLWERLLGLAGAQDGLITVTGTHDVQWDWVPGHRGVLLNERADALASNQALLRARVMSDHTPVSSYAELLA